MRKVVVESCAGLPCKNSRLARRTVYTHRTVYAHRTLQKVQTCSQDGVCGRRYGVLLTGRCIIAHRTVYEEGGGKLRRPALQ